MQKIMKMKYEYVSHHLFTTGKDFQCFFVFFLTETITVYLGGNPFEFSTPKNYLQSVTLALEAVTELVVIGQYPL